MLRSLRSRVALGFGLGVLLLVTAQSWVLGGVASRLALRDQSEALEALARSTAGAFADGLHERLREVTLLAAEPPAAGLAAWERLMLRMQATRRHFSWVGLVDADGRVLAATGGLLVGQDVGMRPWFRASLQGPHVGDVHTAKLLATLLPTPPDGEPLRFIDFAAPLRHGDGRVHAVLGVHADWAWARDVIDSLRGPWAREQGVRVYVLDRSGQVIHRPRDGPAIEPPPIHGAASVAAAVRTWGDGVDYLTTAWRVPARDPAADLGWTVVVRQPLLQALAASREQRRLALGVGGVATVLAALGAWLLAGRFTRPLVRIAAAAQALQQGALHTPIPALGGAREFVQLSQALHRMTATLLQRKQELAEANELLEQRVLERTAELQAARAQLQAANAELHRQASHDALTGLPNRRAGDARLAQEQARALRHGHPLALALIDIDHFKRVNDTHGHAVGDTVLREVAAVLAAQVRGSDFVSRHGGEEFVVLMPDTDADGARAAAEKLRAAVQAHDGAVPVTLSVGVATGVADHDDADAALRAADQALYAAKAAGRNRVVLAPAPPPRPRMDFAASRAGPLEADD